MGRTRAKEPLKLIHTDVCGPMSTNSIGGARYFVTFIDDNSRKTFVYFLKTKDQVFTKFKEFRSMIQNQTGKRIKNIRSDNGGEYLSNNFKKFLKDHGIQHQVTVPYTPEQNGVAERANRIIVEAARSMLYARDMNLEFWAEAISTAVYLKNRSPTKALHDITPEQAWTGKKPSVGHLRSFGCKAYVHVPTQHRSKLDSKTLECVFTGYYTESKGYRVFNIVKQQALISRDVIFDEGNTDIFSLPKGVSCDLSNPEKETDQ